jgi:hypothetical protein
LCIEKQFDPKSMSPRGQLLTFNKMPHVNRSATRLLEKEKNHSISAKWQGCKLKFGQSRCKKLKENVLLGTSSLLRQVAEAQIPPMRTLAGAMRRFLWQKAFCEVFCFVCIRRLRTNFHDWCE